MTLTVGMVLIEGLTATHVMETKDLSCTNCAAPIQVPLGEVETFCEYCGCHLRFLPGEEEMEVVRTREEMKSRERVAVQKEILKQKLQQEELKKWRETAGKVAIAALPLIGAAAGKAVFRSTLQRSGGCLGVGCLGTLVVVGILFAAVLGFF